MIPRSMSLPAAPERVALLGQFLSFGLVGAVLSGLSTLAYLLPIMLLHAPPLLANFIAYTLAVTVGFQLHGRLTFVKSAGGSGASVPVRAGRFGAVSLVSLGLNSLFVWALTGPLRLSPLWPLLPMLFVTPVATFWLNRRWVWA